MSRQIGVEEELLLVDPESRELTSVSDQAVRAFRATRVDTGEQAIPEVEQELFLEQLETATEPRFSLADVRDEIVRCRGLAREAASSAGAGLVAVATPVLGARDREVTRSARYHRIVDEFGRIGEDAGVCAMHVHVDVSDEEEGVAVIDRIRPWLPVLLAVSANSPYWFGEDTGFASWRSRVWGRWPTAGQSEPYGSAAAYRAANEAQVAVGAALDPGMLYLDARLSRFGTVEIRVADVCADVDDAVLLASLARGLVDASAAHWRAGEALPEWRSDLLRAAHFIASRDGLSRSLVDPASQRLAPAADVLAALVDTISPYLDAPERADVADLVRGLFARGTGASRQRSTFEATGSLAAVVDDLIARTAAD